MKTKLVGCSFIFQREVEKDGLVSKNVLRCKDSWDITIYESWLKELDRNNCKYEYVSLFGCFEDFARVININFLIVFNKSNVIDMKKMFYKCKSLNTIKLSDFNTSNVTNMSGIFGECPDLTSLDLSTFNTSSVTSMRFMFSGCSSLISLDLSTFNTSSVTDMAGMFCGCNSLSSLNLSSFNMNNVTNMSQMFDGCLNLKIVDLSKLNDNSFEYIIHGLGIYNSLDNMYMNTIMMMV